MARMTFSTLGAAGIALLMAAAAASAQQNPARIRATIEKVDGNTLTVKARDGKTMTVKTPDNVRVQGLAKVSLADIGVDSFIGVTGMPQADGSVKAIAIHIFTEQQRKVVPQRHGAWDLQPNSTMTNAMVGSKVAAASGNELTVKYQNGEKKVVVTPETAIVKVVGGSKSDIKAGAHIIIMRADPEVDGSFKAGALYVGKDGITPPM
jgi:ABC-type enterochelin transport system substrate-binding protein